MAVAKSFSLLTTGDVFGGVYRTANRSTMIMDNVSVAVIVGSAQVVGKKSIIFDVCNAFVSLM